MATNEFAIGTVTVGSIVQFDSPSWVGKYRVWRIDQAVEIVGHDGRNLITRPGGPQAHLRPEPGFEHLCGTVTQFRNPGWTIVSVARATATAA